MVEDLRKELNGKDTKILKLKAELEKMKTERSVQIEELIKNIKNDGRKRFNYTQT